MNRREREIKDQIAKVGLEVVEYDMTGGSPHIKVKVCHPLMKDKRRTFVYARNAQGDVRRSKNEEHELLRWKRDITEPANHHVEGPMEAALKKMVSGPTPTLPPPIVYDAPPRSHRLNPVTVATLQPSKWRADAPRDPGRDEKYIALEYEIAHKRDPRHDPILADWLESHPSEKSRVENLFGKPATPAKEPPMDTAVRRSPEAAANASAARKGIKPNILSRPQEIKLIDWLRKPGLLDSTNAIILAEKATKELGFTVTNSNVLGLLKDLELKITNPTRRDFGRSGHVTRHDYLAQCLVAVIEHTGGTVPNELMKLAVGDHYDLRFADASLPTWPGKE